LKKKYKKEEKALRGRQKATTEVGGEANFRKTEGVPRLLKHETRIKTESGPWIKEEGGGRREASKKCQHEPSRISRKTREGGRSGK